MAISDARTDRTPSGRYAVCPAGGEAKSQSSLTGDRVCSYQSFGGDRDQAAPGIQMSLSALWPMPQLSRMIREHSRI